MLGLGRSKVCSYPGKIRNQPSKLLCLVQAEAKYAAILEKLEINLLNYYAENIENACKTYLW